MKKIILIIIVSLISCQGKIPYDLGDNFFLDYDRNGYFSIIEVDEEYKGTSGKIISSEIISINVDNDFIIAKIKPIDKIEKIEDSKKTLNYNDLKRKILTSNMQEYWIVDKKVTPKTLIDKGGNVYSISYCIHGPFNIDEYKKKRIEINVPKKLKLIEVNLFLKKK